MSIFKCHKKYINKSLSMFGLSYYQGFWISFIKGLIFGAIIMWFISCEEKIVVKNSSIEKPKASSIINADYSIGVKGNCGMCKTSIEKAVINLDLSVRQSGE